MNFNAHFRQMKKTQEGYAMRMCEEATQRDYFYISSSTVQ